jgi:hypothetical protein
MARSAEQLIQQKYRVTIANDILAYLKEKGIKNGTRSSVLEQQELPEGALPQGAQVR